MAGIYVTFNSLRLDLDGFCGAEDIDDLIGLLGPMRGSDVALQGVDGQTFRPKVRDAAIAVCSWKVFGLKDESGSAHPDKWSGLRDNVETILSTVKTATKSAPKTLTVTYPDAGTRSASAWVYDHDLTSVSGSERLPIARRLVLDIRIPSGQLT